MRPHVEHETSDAQFPKAAVRPISYSMEALGQTLGYGVKFRNPYRR